MNSTPEGLLDTNPFLHALASDAHTAECRRFLAALERGQVQARMEPLILHELSYALRHYIKQITREQIASHLLTVLSWDGVLGEKDILTATVDRWRTTPGLGFPDAYLATLAATRQCPVYTKNIRDFTRQGVDVPDPLPDGTS